MILRQEGQSLWEVIIALTLAGLIALGLVRLTTSAVKSARFSLDQSQITAFAQEKIAEVINYQNDHYIDFWNTVENIPSDAGIAISSFIDYPYTDGYNETLQICSKITIFNSSSLLPQGSSGLMAKIVVDVYWDKKGDESDCRIDDTYLHSLQFNTYVTKKND